MSILRDWWAPPRPDEPSVVRDPAERRALTIELVVVFAVTLGLSAVGSLLSLVDSLLKPQALADQNVGLNDSQAQLGLIDFALQVTQALRLVAWGALGVFLLWRGGIALWRVGLDRTRPGRDVLAGAGLAALIGIPGLGLYLTAHALGFALTVQPSTLDEAWWRGPVLILSAFGNSFAEEVLMIGYLLTRLRQLGWSENASLWVAAVIRGSYHLYQGVGGFVGNIVMGLVYGRIWQRTNRLWPLIVGHALIDVVAFVGYALLRDHLSWLP
ncbi:CPBP family intramembrane glutamic endopeptidase [Allosaccharopolyspora coralli]|uniref:CPBP family intramembrane glutamic endopeptidase n=1 Tax=Allosaccharopolyspora coralli TaxID=2665642 RepID=UPI0016524F6D|nr:CPBP family intramembrane glutamic endopeptidase [Allosaccharopolyspora coralli]